MILGQNTGNAGGGIYGEIPDVPNGQFYTSAVLWASQKEVGIITGYDNTGHFGPADQITREQLVTMMYRYAGFVKADRSIKKELDEFPDADMVNAFASDAMKWAVGTGMIKGDNGYLNPGGNANRAECATIIMRFIRYSRSIRRSHRKIHSRKQTVHRIHSRTVHKISRQRVNRGSKRRQYGRKEK